jgi:eukaryotic translation initiation factor 2C
MELVYLKNVLRASTNIEQYKLPTDFKQRPGFNTSGKAIQVAVNSYPVTQYPNVKVFQYDVGSLLGLYS